MSDSEMVVECRNCGEDIPTTATRCPQCDARVTTTPWGIGLAVFGLLVALGFVYGHFAGYILDNWQAGVAAGVFISLMGGRLYWIRRQKLANARPR
jgi:hypothetical protein